MVGLVPLVRHQGPSHARLQEGTAMSWTHTFHEAGNGFPQVESDVVTVIDHGCANFDCKECDNKP
jgi:hypothetical protein